MAWTYSGDPSTSLKDTVRFVIGDTEEDFPLLQDGEIEFALSLKNDVVISASIECCRAILAKFAKQVDYSVGPERISASDRYKHFRSLLRELQTQVKNATQAPLGGPSTDSIESIFGIGMHDNS